MTARKAATKRNPVARALRLLGRRIKPSGKLYRRGRAAPVITCTVIVLALTQMAFAAPYEQVLTLVPKLDNPILINGGYELMNLCEKAPGRCITFISSAVDWLNMRPPRPNLAPIDCTVGCSDIEAGIEAAGFVINGDDPVQLCIPQQATPIEKAYVVQLYVEAHPQDLIDAAGQIILDAMHWGFHCPANATYHTP